MKTINFHYFAKQEIKKSNFLTYLVPFDKFDETHEKLKLEHPKAVHIVWAYRHYNKYFQIVENQSDDGEPKGTSGPPALNALRGADLINVGVFIVRYFGGIKLGTGGLVRAYSSSVNLAINEANLIEFEIRDELIFFVPFALISRFEHFLEKENFKSKNKFNEYGVNISLNINENEFINLYKFAKPFKIEGVKFLYIPLFAKNILI
ncbi:YigZ family protein [Campylobacter sp. FMV-PI01]|uniref:YigZ family protein n=1 Tax=Campylobacter portucalensis TaxID=2608384 RepID=A0A6L5WMH9_9BACT|nr:YigZ family protein [Campylobacter portucalensis]MSN96861.1 YigZ family protein [Campylobacter portucalensis]